MYIFLTKFLFFCDTHFDISFQDFQCYFSFNTLFLIEDPPENKPLLVMEASS